MRIAIIGYGRMGKTIERIALERGHVIAAIIDENNGDELNHLDEKDIDVAIEFTQPESAFDNIMNLLKQDISVVSGTTGWLDRIEEVESYAISSGNAFFYAPNYSIGVNLFFAINEYAAKLLNKFTTFDVHIEEVHHIHKLDAPSGTAIRLAEDVIQNLDRKNRWENHKTEENNILDILSFREPEIAGIHKTIYTGATDEINLGHTAQGRDGFATGAVIAAEFIKEKTGIYSMKDILDL